MGILDIIKDDKPDTPADIFFNDELIDEEDTQVVDVYSDTSSDTEQLPEGFSDYAESLLESYSLSESSDDYSNEIFEVNVKCRTSDTIEKKTTNILKNTQNISSRTRSNIGKKKARRLENARQLDLLSGDDVTDECDINDFMPVDCSFRFSTILEDKELTDKILNPSINCFDENYISSEPSDLNKRKKKLHSIKPKKLSARAAFNNLYSSEKTFFRRRNLPMGMVQYLDTCLFSFFENNPTGTYVSEPLSSFERMMLHSIAHYYELNSFSCNMENRDLRFTKVTNNLDFFNPPYLCLSQYLEQQHVKNIDSNPKCKRFQKKVMLSCAHHIG